MSDFLETVFHLDLQNDVPGIVECIRQSSNDSNLLFSALCQLLLRRQTRSAFLIAQYLLNMGNHHTVLGFAGAVGGYIFNLPDELTRGLNHLRAQSDIQAQEQHDVDVLVKRRQPIRITRQTWLREAIYEKVLREQKNSVMFALVARVYADFATLWCRKCAHVRR